MESKLVLAPTQAALNESPSEKEGKFDNQLRLLVVAPLNESPSEKEGKFFKSRNIRNGTTTLNESPSEKEGKSNRQTSHRRRN